ncbi:helix-turn-helix domain-containing protein [Streptomyces sp. ms191]|uniref:helix-turn-helix domain-containing protein n=1 Tax=Streptomyces sp. ms191 TaxID=1827978 RepID=UPI0011CE3B27|nr:helix-turn-helix domain-containing protein [Streptomyces sp. ms191]TXS22627.1 helix-turn-helix domain-containing protein [Streptomyces sp. ms191]
MTNQYGADHHNPPVTDEERAEIRRLHAEGHGRNEISRRTGRSLRTISVQAERMGLTFDRTMTAVATEARVIDGRARRAAILAGLYEVAEAELDYLRQGGQYALVEVSSGKAVRFNADRLPAQDRRALITGISTAMTAAARLESMEGDPGITGAASLLMNLSDAFRLAAGPPEDDTGEG